MSTSSPLPPPTVAPDLEGVRRSWGWFVLLGIGLIILGSLAISLPLIATFDVIFVVGILLLIGGVMQAGTAIWARSWRGFFLHLLASVLDFIVGLLMLEHPGQAAAALTLLLAAFFLVGGLFRIVVALAEQFHGWGWVFVNGLITLALGIMIWRGWPQTSLWIIGLFVGIDLIFNGWAALMLGFGVRNLGKTAA